MARQPEAAERRATHRRGAIAEQGGSQARARPSPGPRTSAEASSQRAAEQPHEAAERPMAARSSPRAEQPREVMKGWMAKPAMAVVRPARSPDGPVELPA